MNKKIVSLKTLESKNKKIKCGLKKTATNLVFGRGNPSAKIMFVGEAPGKNEDLQGVPFVGSAGKKLIDWLNKSEISEEEIYITNIVKYRPPKNRNPTLSEIKLHAPFLLEQINIIQPRVICCLGNFSSKFLLANDFDDMKNVNNIGRIHGRIFKKNIFGKDYLVMPFFHPAAVIYNRKLESLVLEDFKKLKKILENKSN